MTYTYTDSDGDTLRVWGTEHYVYASATDGDHPTLIGIKPDDAPAVALALLEAAGYSGEGEDLADQASNHLAAFVHAQKAWVAREAEDAKVDEYRRVKVGPDAPFTPWEHLTEPQRDLWRKDYSVTREFFTREHEQDWRDKTAPPIGDLDCVATTDEIIAALDDKPTPRVLNYGDPEPGRGTTWRDSSGGIVRYFPKDAGWGNTVGRVWEGLGNHWFPMTEVTGE